MYNEGNVQGGVREMLEYWKVDKTEQKGLILSFAVKERHDLPFLAFHRDFDKLVQFSDASDSVLMTIIQNN